MTTWRKRQPSPPHEEEADPLAGVANLFDVSVVFIVGLMVALFGTFKLKDLVDARSEVTVVRTNANGEREVVIKKGRKVETYKVGNQIGVGNGKRLGTAYELESGQLVYVPENASADVRP